MRTTPARLLTVSLAASCAKATPSPPTEPPPNVVPPTPEQLGAWAQQAFGDSDFDWGCCDVWYRQCVVDGRPIEGECEWICNG